MRDDSNPGITGGTGVDQRPGGSPVTTVLAEALTEKSVLSECQSLYDYVDTDALDGLVENTPATARLAIVFEIEDTTVLVFGDGSVRLG